ncbi:MAG: hypothetical protein AAGA23_05965 [Pseudomonadota bacterium]
MKEAAFLLGLLLAVARADGQTQRMIVVEPLADSETELGCTLREAVDVASAGLMEGLGCVFEQSGSGFPIHYTLAVPAYEYAVSSLVIQGHLTVVGRGIGETIIRGTSALNGTFDVISLAGRLVLENLTITGSGEAVRNRGDVTIRNVDVQANSSGGIVNHGSVRISDSIVRDNQSDYGGGIYSAGSLTVENSVLAGNRATRSGGGIYSLGTMAIVDSSIVSNSTQFSRALEGGGGIYLAGKSTLSRVAVADNRSTLFGGGILAVQGGDLLLRQSSVSRNVANNRGGGLYIDSMVVDIANSTIARNVTGDAGGAIAVGPGSEVYLSHVTVYENEASETGGVANLGSRFSVVQVYSSIVADNQSGDCLLIESNGYNVLGDPKGCAAAFPAGQPNANGDYVGFESAVVLELGNLRYANPRYHPARTSVVVNKIPTQDCVYRLSQISERSIRNGEPVTADQRGRERDNVCDIGAVESAGVFRSSFERVVD